jgi:23S rRNA (guanine2445-N2)-methyltransferase / 23S rRNA (guanine2069-N7)-methyltransferase
MSEVIVTTSKGLDELLKKEVEAILAGTVDVKLKPGQVSFDATLEQAYSVCLHSRLANRVLWVVGSGKVNSAEELYDVVKAIDWPSHFESYVPFMIQFNGTNNAINNSQFGALKAKDALSINLTPVSLYKQDSAEIISIFVSTLAVVVYINVDIVPTLVKRR